MTARKAVCKRFFVLSRRIIVCGLLLSVACLARAVAGDELSVGLGGRVSVMPYKRYDTLWTPVPIVSYEGQYAYVRGLTAGVKLMNFEFLEVSTFAEYDDTCFRPDRSSDERLRKLSGRHPSVAAGMEARLITPYGMLRASGAQDILGHSKGLAGLIGYMNSLEFGPLELIPSAGMRWSSNRYNGYYYGVSGKESLKSGMDFYDTGGSVSPYAELTIDYSLTNSWEVYCGGELVFLSSTIRNSPMAGRTNTYSLMLGISYTF